MSKIKICGLSRQCDAEYANILLPDYIGFVFAQKSKRYISPKAAISLRDKLDKRICTVGVFVNEPIENVAQLLNDGIIDMAQLHGNEDKLYINKLHCLTDKKIIKSFTINSILDIKAAEISCADYILLDNGNGGTGSAFDWSLVQSIKRSFFLAGGLSTDNISLAISLTQPFAVDVSSGVETLGLKDYDKMHRFIMAVREEQ